MMHVTTQWSVIQLSAELCSATHLNVTNNMTACLCKSNCMHMQIIETKVKKLEQLVRLKDAKIQTLISKMQAAGLA